MQIHSIDVSRLKEERGEKRRKKMSRVRSTEEERKKDERMEGRIILAQFFSW
jgi:hypothetical protein